MEVITKDTEEVKAYFEALERGMRYVDNVTANFRPAMNGEVYLTGEEVCRILHITNRTLQDYRAHRIIPFISLPGKTLYRQSDLLRMLDENYVQMKPKSKRRKSST
ncbi:helix-turn-helix domain-containing protein [Bacteroides ovatus]|uniref:helix-turn-helix domain-containing protein n=1 Tax=Bacteroides ovatus TaxID=28116 RepID=UPI00189CA152|nr:helix-turn-helix domain-containing protein [Bacteroides ovatus]MDC2661267.1 helix-turn-helix domain-containing protein [Bacteroides ovatus]